MDHTRAVSDGSSSCGSPTRPSPRTKGNVPQQARSSPRDIVFSDVERVAWPSVAAAVDKFNDGSVPSAVAADVPQLALHAGS